MAPTYRLKTRSTVHEFDLIHALRKQHNLRTPSVIRGIGGIVADPSNHRWRAEGMLFTQRMNEVEFVNRRPGLQSVRGRHANKPLHNHHELIND